MEDKTNRTQKEIEETVSHNISLINTALSEKAEKMGGTSSSFTLSDSLDRDRGRRKKLKDEYGNKLLSIGSNDISKSFDSYSLDNDTLNFRLWISLYNSSWVFRRVIDKPAQDRATAGIKIVGNGNYDKIYKQINEHTSDLSELLMWGGLFGGSVAVMRFNGILLTDMEKPFNVQINKINKNAHYLMRMYVTDRWYGCSPTYDDLVTNPNNIDFGKPKYYFITFTDGKTYKIHHSWILRYEHRTAPKRIKNGYLQGWGYSEGAHLFNELRRDDKLKSSIQSLLDKSLIEVVKRSGMRGLFMSTDPVSKKQIEARLESVTGLRSFNSLTFLDKDDDYQMNSFSGVSGLADLLQQNRWLVSAATERQGILYGHLNNGFSGDEDAMERWDKTIHSRANTYFRPVMDKLIYTLCRLYGINYNSLSYDFNSIAIDQVNDKKMDAISKLADTVGKMVESGYRTAEQAGLARQKFAQTNILDFNLNEESVKQAVKENGSELDDLDNMDLDEEEDAKQKEVKQNEVH